MSEPKSKRMLVILAHPDDESYGMGGTLAKYSHQGVQIILICATRGEAGISGKQSAETGKIREHELRQAAMHLGIEVYFLGYQDGQLADGDQTELFEHIACWIDMVHPQVILTFGPEGVSGHPDHVTVSKMVTRVVNQFFPGVWLYYLAPSEATALGCGVTSSNAYSDDQLLPVDISGYKIEKALAIQSHISQYPPLEGRPEEMVDKIPCYEYFTLAQKGNDLNDSVDWFECAEKVFS